MVSNRFLGSIGNAIDSAASGTFLAKRASGPVFETLDYSDISDYPTGANVDSAAIINLIDSNFLSTRTPGIDITTVITDSGLNHIVPDSAGEVVKIGNYSKGISNVFADSGTTIKISSHTISLSTDHILLDGGTAASDYSGGSGAGGASFTWGGDRGLHAHGFNGSAWLNSIDYFNITSSGNASDFGDLTVTRAPAAAGSSARCCFGAGMSPRVDTIDYITTATTGNATDFGDLSQDKSALSSASNGTRALWLGGYVQGASPTYENKKIEYVTIDTTGNATDFGELTEGASQGAGISNNTYGLLAGGYGRIGGSGTYKQSIDKVTIATTGNATDHGDLTKAQNPLNGASDTTRGIIASGYDPNASGGSYTADIEYIAIATAPNATDFGDLSVVRKPSATSNGTYAVFVAGEGSSLTNIVDIVTIQTPGNATDHGDLTTTSGRNGAWSGNAA